MYSLFMKAQVMYVYECAGVSLRRSVHSVALVISLTSRVHSARYVRSVSSN